jgi:hypothetical protein
MKKHYILKTIVVILLVFLAFSLAGCVTDNVYSNYLYSEISLSDDLQLLTVVSPEGERMQYEHISTVSSAELHGVKYLYEEIAILNDGYVADVYSPVADKDVIYLNCYGTVYCYVRESCQSERQDMLAFLGGEGSIFSIADMKGNKEGVLSREEYHALCAPPKAENTVKVDVTVLKNVTSYDILSYDSYHVLNMTSGKIFYYDNAYLLVDYQRLDNSAFDAEGNLSFRKGEIEAERLTGEKLELFKDIFDKRSRIKNETQFEEGLFVGQEENERTEEVANFAVLSFVFFIGILIPAVPVIFMLTYALTARRRALVLGDKRKTRVSVPLIVMGAGALIWLISGVTMLILLLL